MTIAAGTRLGHYEITALLGVGGMGEVYLAHDFKLKRMVALKVLSPEVARDQSRLGRFLQEARTASAFSHPNVVSIYEIEDAAEVCFIAMEYVDGETLRQRLARTTLTIAEVLDLGVQVVGALSAAHASGIIHRDIKADNVMVSRDGYVKVLDFGLAKPAPASDGPDDVGASTVSHVATAPGVVMGTVSYMSPEQARGVEVDARTDIWSTGVLLYEMATGRLPFEGATASEVVASVLNREPHPLARFSREAPEAFEWIIAKALTKEREGRYQTAKELLIDLQRLKHRLDVEAELGRGARPDGAGRHLAAAPSGAPSNGASTTQSSAEYLVSGIRRHKARTAVVAGCLAVALAAAAYAALWARRRPPRTGATPLGLQRLTFDSGLQLNPTWSPDGRFIAYSSDRKGNFDIWVQQSDGGNPVPVIASPYHDWQPDWSPDGRHLVFRSERGGGGLFVAPAFGGIERKISSFGYRPRWAPDSSQVLFLDAGQRVYDFPKVYVVNLSDAQPREIPILVSEDKEEGAKQGAVDWHPDGRRISFLSVDGAFWTVPAADSGGGAVKSEMSPEVEARFKQVALDVGNFRWAPTGAALYFEGSSHGVVNLWKVTVDAQTLRWVGGPERLTTTPGQDKEIALSSDGSKLAYVSVSQSTRLWLFPFDAAAGKLKGAGQPVTPPDVNHWFVDLSRDGRQLVYLARKHGMSRPELWARSMEDGRETLLASDNYFRFLPRWAPDGQRLAYSRFRSLVPDDPTTAGPPKGFRKEGPIVVLDVASGQEQPLTSPGPWLDYMYDWSPDGQWVLGSTNRDTPERWRICLFPVEAAPRAETQMREVASDPENSLWAPRFSPDGRWISYIAQKVNAASASVVYVVPAGGGTPVRITEAGSWADWPRWSPDGRTIYFASDTGSLFLNIWGIRFDPASGRPQGQPFRVTEFESPGRMISTQLAHTEMSLSASRLALPVTDVSGSIWLLSNLDR